MQNPSQALVRNAISSDANALSKLLVLTFEEAYEGVHSPENIRAYCDSNYSAGEVSEVLQDAGASWMWLVVSDLNHRAQSFYRKRGFQPLGNGPELIVGFAMGDSEEQKTQNYAIIWRSGWVNIRCKSWVSFNCKSTDYSSPPVFWR